MCVLGFKKCIDVGITALLKLETFRCSCDNICKCVYMTNKGKPKAECTLNFLFNRVIVFFSPRGTSVVANYSTNCLYYHHHYFPLND